jgi:hypothetical protein
MAVVAENVDSGRDLGLPNVPLENLVHSGAVNLNRSLLQATPNWSWLAVVKHYFGFSRLLIRTEVSSSGLGVRAAG